MAADVVPGLQQEIMTKLRAGLSGNKQLTRLCGRLADGTATYMDAFQFSNIVGEQTSGVLMQVLKPEILPDRRLYYNIGERTVRPAVELSNGMINEFTDGVQTLTNRRAGLNIKSIKARQDIDNLNNIIGMASDYLDFADGMWLLDKPIQTNMMSLVDRTIRANAYFADAAGVKAVVVRTAEANCCDWCAELEGSYDYSDNRQRGMEIYKRHNNCHCVVEYYPGEGSRVQNVHISHDTDGSWRYFRDPGN